MGGENEKWGNRSGRGKTETDRLIRGHEERKEIHKGTNLDEHKVMDVHGQDKKREQEETVCV